MQYTNDNLDTKKLLQIMSNEYLELIILPTEQCNFRCTYCYEDFSIGKMQRPTIDGIKNLISKRMPELKILKISWFGGEPLAAKDVIAEICQHIIELKSQFPKLHYESVMTTNGYHLNQAMLHKLSVLGMNDYQISLDGHDEVHNQTRIRADGAGTFQKIWENLLAAKNTDLDFGIMIRIHVTPDNIASLPILINRINLNFRNDPRFRLFFKAIEDLGGPNSKSFNVLKGKDKQTILNELYTLVDPKILIEKIENKKPYICYAAQGNSFVIRANGKLGKCTVALNDMRNDIGHLSADGHFMIDNKKFQPWVRGVSNFNLKNLECPMVNFPNHAVLGRQIIPVKVENG